MDGLAGMAIEKAGELILNPATKKIAEYKEKKEWEKLMYIYLLKYRGCT